MVGPHDRRGEDPKFIARRLLISASEDIGHANPTALVLANATFDAVERLGYPECRIPLSQCATYLASSPKSNSAYAAIGAPRRRSSTMVTLPVPMHLRNAPTKLMKELGHGSGYQYDHDHGGFSGQECLPKHLIGQRFFKPGHTPRERGIAEFLRSLVGRTKGLIAACLEARDSDHGKSGEACNLLIHRAYLCRPPSKAMCKPI